MISDTVFIKQTFNAVNIQLKKFYVTPDYKIILKHNM